MGKLLTYTSMVKEEAETILREFYETAEHSGLVFDEDGCCRGIGAEIMLDEFSVISDGIFSVNYKKYNVTDYVRTGKFEHVIDVPNVVTVLKSKDDTICMIQEGTDKRRAGILVGRNMSNGNY